MELAGAVFMGAFGVYMCISGYQIAMKSWEKIARIFKP